MHLFAWSLCLLVICACGAAGAPTGVGEREGTEAVAPAALADAAVLLQTATIVEDSPPADVSEPVSAATYRTRAHERRENREAAHLGAYDALLRTLGQVPNMQHSEHILSYVRDKDYGPSLLHGGCLYLPSNEAWTEFYSYVGHPYPPLFAEMVARSFFSKCDAAASGAQRSVECTDGRLLGAHKCVEARRVGEVEHQGSTIQLFQTDGHIALPQQWKHHIDLVSQSGDALRRAEPERDLPKDKCSKSWLLPPVPEGRKLVVPTQYIVCSSTPSHPGINREMLLGQARWMNVAYSGRSTYSPMDFDREDIPQADMQMHFDLFKKNCTPNAFDDCARITFAHDKECAEQAFVESKFVARHNHDPFGLFTVIFVGDDKSGILGMAEFPQLTGEGQRELVVRVSTTGLRHFSSTNKNLKLDTGYDEGDTVVHEAGHSLGLYHTFQGGCAMDGDNVADTQPEAMPNYKCTQPKSCGKADPVHNFMDYPEDACMDGFTELQKRRVWCVFENYRPELYQKSLVISTEA
jgi:hypothetical protein